MHSVNPRRDDRHSFTIPVDIVQLFIENDRQIVTQHDRNQKSEISLRNSIWNTIICLSYRKRKYGWIDSRIVVPQVTRSHGNPTRDKGWFFACYERGWFGGKGRPRRALQSPLIACGGGSAILHAPLVPVQGLATFFICAVCVRNKGC